jgi:hypothetical protein
MDRKKIAGWSMIVAMMAVVGCSLNRTAEVRHDQLLAQADGRGNIIEPKRSHITVIHLTRPLRDDVVEKLLWQTADEMVIPPETRRVLRANGLRIGVVFGALPPEVEAVIKAPPPNKIDPAEFLLGDSDDGSLLGLSPKVAEAHVLLNQKGRPLGRDFRDAEGFFRLNANHKGADGVGLRFVPEIHHGPIQQSYVALPGANRGFAPRELTIKTGQKEESFRELAASVVLKPNQIAVVGGFADRRRTLGSLMFTQNEPNSDRLLQTVLLIWAKQAPRIGGPNPPLPALVPVDPPT